MSFLPSEFKCSKRATVSYYLVLLQLNSEAGHNICQQSTPSPQLHKASETGLQSRVDSQHLEQDVVSEGHKSHTHTETFLSDTTTHNGKLDMHWVLTILV